MRTIKANVYARTNIRRKSVPVPQKREGKLSQGRSKTPTEKKMHNKARMREMNIKKNIANQSNHVSDFIYRKYMYLKSLLVPTRKEVYVCSLEFTIRIYTVYIA